MAAIERQFVTHGSQEVGHAAPAGPHREAPGSARREREGEENTGRRLYHDFHGKKWASRASRLRIARLNNISGLWGRGAVPSHRAPGPGVFRAGG